MCFPGGVTQEHPRFILRSQHWPLRRLSLPAPAGAETQPGTSPSHRERERVAQPALPPPLAQALTKRFPAPVPASCPWYFPLAKPLLCSSPPHPSTPLHSWCGQASSSPAPRFPLARPCRPQHSPRRSFLFPEAGKCSGRERLTQPRITRRTTHAARRPREPRMLQHLFQLPPQRVSPQLLKSSAQFPP